jgi:hypothetical protein
VRRPSEKNEAVHANKFTYNGRKKKIWLNSNSVNAKHTTPIVDETNDMKVGSIKKDIVYLTRSKPLSCDKSARSQRCTMCTEYSTAKPTLSTKDMFEKPVRLTPAKTLRPTTVTSDTIIVTAMRRAPIKLPQKILD